MLLVPVSVFAGTASLSWTAPTQYEDGTPLPTSEIQSYKIYYGTASKVYSSSISVTPTTLSYVVSNLSNGTYYFAITTVATNGAESAYSNEATKLVQTKRPKSPGNVR